MLISEVRNMNDNGNKLLYVLNWNVGGGGGVEDV